MRGNAFAVLSSLKVLSCRRRYLRWSVGDVVPIEELVFLDDVIFFGDVVSVLAGRAGDQGRTRLRLRLSRELKVMNELFERPEPGVDVDEETSQLQVMTSRK